MRKIIDFIRLIKVTISLLRDGAMVVGPEGKVLLYRPEPEFEELVMADHQGVYGGGELFTNPLDPYDGYVCFANGTWMHADTFEYMVNNDIMEIM
jgi:hypothetical protein